MNLIGNIRPPENWYSMPLTNQKIVAAVASGINSFSWFLIDRPENWYDVAVGQS